MFLINNILNFEIKILCHFIHSTLLLSFILHFHCLGQNAFCIKSCHFMSKIVVQKIFAEILPGKKITKILHWPVSL